MKKSFLAFILSTFIIFIGCEKDFDAVVDQSPASFQVIGLRSIDTVRFIPGDSLLLMTITFNGTKDLRNAYSDIYSSAGSKLNSGPINLFDNGRPENGDQAAGDKTYSNKFPLSQANPNGLYTIRYYAQDKNNVTKQVAIQNFNFDNGQTNVAPFISNLVAPDSTKLDTVKTLIFLSIKAEDQNGQNDIELVYFNSFIPPNGNPSSTNPFKMYDDGTNGDQVNGDGIFSLIIELPPTGVTKGNYRWEFQARDRGKKLSNVIIHNILIY